jgi:hypothetical protein
MALMDAYPLTLAELSEPLPYVPFGWRLPEQCIAWLPPIVELGLRTQGWANHTRNTVT